MIVDDRVSAHLDIEIEKASAALLAELGISSLADEVLEGLLFAVDNPFIDEEEPMDFASFSVALDEIPLSDYQVDLFARMGVLTARGFFSRVRRVREAVLALGKGCLSEDSLLTDELTGGSKTVKEWESSGESISIRSYNWKTGRVCIKTTSPVFCKGSAPLFKVTLQCGREFTSTEEHEVLTESGWKHLKDTSVGESILSLNGKGLPIYSQVVSITPVGEGDYYDLTVEDTGCYFDSQGVLHHNSGKDWITARFFCWITYILFKMKNPKQYLRPRLKTSADERIDIINIAPKGELAKEVFFEYLKRNFKRPFFRPYLLNEREQILTNRIYFPQLNLHVLSLNSSASGLDGYNPLLWVMDEADAFLDNANKSNAEGLQRILASSAGTRWPGMWFGMILSYLRSGSGYMARRIAKVREFPSPSIFVAQAASWTVNPNISRDDDDVKQAYFEDPVAAAAMYEGLAPPVKDPFIHRHEFIRISVGDHKGCVVSVIHNDPNNLILREINGQEKGYVWLEVVHIKPEPGRRYYMGVDAAETGDAFAISVVSVADDSLLGPSSLCPRCWGQGKSFYMESLDGYAPYPPETNPADLVCSICGYTTEAFQAHNAPAYQKVLGWHRRLSKESDFQLITIGGETVKVPHIREDVLINIQPIQKRAVPTLPDGAAVDLLSAQKAMEDLCRGLSITQAGFDTHQMAGTIQYLSAATSTSIYRCGFSNPEQFLRMRLFRFLLYSGLVTLAGEGVTDKNTVELGIRELEQLQKIKQILDHPQGGCLCGDTLIDTNLGPKRIQDIVAGDVVFGYSDGLLEAATGRARVTKHTLTLVEIELGTGERLRCTPDHPFLLTNRTYKEAQYLTPDDELQTGAWGGMRMLNVTPLQLECPVPVYDIEVPATSNFKLSLGPVVHNSKDIADARGIAFFLAAQDNLGGGAIEWLFREKSGEEVGKAKEPKEDPSQ